MTVAEFEHFLRFIRKNDLKFADIVTANSPKNGAKPQNWERKYEHLNNTHNTLNITMTQEKSTQSNNTNASTTNTQGNTGTQNLPAKQPQKVVIRKFDELDEENKYQLAKQIETAQQVTLDEGLLRENLARAHIEQRPSDELINMAIEARKAIASEFARGYEARNYIPAIYQKARTEGFNPEQSRKLVEMLVGMNGRIVSARTIRRNLPLEAKNTNKVRVQEEKKHVQLPEEKEGGVVIHVTRIMCEAIAKFQKDSNGCVIVLKGKKVASVKATPDEILRREKEAAAHPAPVKKSRK